MKKKTLQSILLTGAIGMMAYGVSAQKGLTDKKMHPQNVLVEDFTGALCGYCPDATDRIEAMKAANGKDRIYAMGVHAGSFTGSKDEFLNAWADKLLAHAGSPGSKPIGRVNRRLDGGSKAYSRGNWSKHADAVLAAGNAVVNLGAMAIMKDDKIMIDVEAYFPTSFGKNVRLATAVVQTGYTSYQSDYGPNGNWNGDYVNIDALRWMSTTDALGETLTSTNKDDFHSYSYTCNIESGWAGKPTDEISYHVILFATDGDNGEVLQVVGIDIKENGIKHEGQFVTGGSTQKRYFPSGTTKWSDEWAGVQTSINDLVAKTDITVYPNPMNENSTLSITVHEAANISYEVVNVLGEVVSSKDLGEVNGLSEVKLEGDFTSISGTYILRVNLYGEVVTHRLSVM